MSEWSPERHAMVRRHITELIASDVTAVQAGYQLAGMATVHLEPALDEIERLDNENRQLREIVREMANWPVETMRAVGARCPVCGEDKWHAHSPTCLWVRAVKLAEGFEHE